MNLLILLPGDPAKSIWALSSGQDLVWLILSLFMLLAMIGVGVLALNLLLTIQKALNPASVPVIHPVEPRSLWQRITTMPPSELEKSLVMDHAYDGISELDNPPPPWFMWLFYSTIAIAVLYLIGYHVIGTGDIMGREYTQEVAIADKARDIYIARVAGSINENTVTQLKDGKGIGLGKVIFTENCVVCHGANAEGKIGPNLTDVFWLHGGKVKNIFHTLTVGVPEKGMMAWKNKLNPLQLQQLASYILSLQGSNPAGAKAPQGEKETPGVPAAGAPVAMR